MRIVAKIAALVIFPVMVSYAGRPVFHDLTTADLVGRASWVVLVTNLKVKKTKLKCGWDSEVYDVEVVKVLKPSEKSEFKPGQKIEFNPRPTAKTDCELRAENPSGASFSAERYKSSLDVSKLNSSSKFFVFLKKSGDQLVLVADGAIEGPGAIPESQ